MPTAIAARENRHTTRTGKVGPVCESCGRKGRAVERLNIGTIGLGWSVAPYPAEYVHADGSTGARYVCPTCNGKR